MKNLKECLAEYGLSDKESNVYLAMLELGPASVQDIAKKSGVNRATTYVMIESLKRRGLMSTFDEGKKTMFVAESPERLKRLIEKDMSVIQEKENRLKEAMPTFLALFNSSSEEKPNVRFFEGEEGLRTVREIYLQTRGEILTITAIDEDASNASKIDESQRMFLTRQLRGRTIVALKNGVQLPIYNKENWQVKFIPYEQNPFFGEMTLFDDKVAIILPKAKPIVFLFENKQTRDMLKAMFEFMWRGAQNNP
jgi:sugar-specific transcriptional regulator TrmB